jgi:hypothetical protein
MKVVRPKKNMYLTVTCPEISKMKYRNRIPEPGTCYWSQWSVDKMVSYFIGGVMVSILALSVLDP